MLPRDCRRRPRAAPRSSTSAVLNRSRNRCAMDASDGAWTLSMRDLRYGCRMIARAPGFSAVVVATLALSIGANVTMFSVMHAVLLRGLPYPAADRLVVVDADVRGVTAAGISGAEAIDLRSETGLFERLATIVRVDAHLTSDGEYEQVPAASATDDALPMLGAERLAYGRTLDTRRDTGADGYVRAVVISHELWTRRFNADPAAIGRVIEVNNLNVEIVGVLPVDFRVFLPANAAFPEVVDVWFPIGFETDRRSRGQITIARVAADISFDEAQARVEALGARFQRRRSHRRSDRSPATLGHDGRSTTSGRCAITSTHPLPTHALRCSCSPGLPRPRSFSPPSVFMARSRISRRNGGRSSASAWRLVRLRRGSCVPWPARGFCLRRLVRPWVLRVPLP